MIYRCKKSDHPEAADMYRSNENTLETVNGSTRRQTVATLLLLFAAAFAVRFICSLLFRQNPQIIIDENLYTNLARFLSDGFTVSYRGQPIDYPSLLYPLVLCPVYALERLIGGDIYRWVQGFNSLLMASTVFPMFLFAKDFTGSDKKAITASVLCLLMPDMLFSEMLMTEALMWPLALWMMVFAYRAYRAVEHGENGVKYGILTGVFTFAMFVTKPGAICAGAVLTVLLLFRSAGKKHSSMPALFSLITIVVLSALWYGAYYLFLDRANTSALGLYEKQLSEFKPSDLILMAEAALLTPLMCVFALAGVFALLPVIRRKEYSDDRRAFVMATVIAVLAAGVGSAVFVTPYRWEYGPGAIPVHMRYISMLLPAFFAFTLALPESGKGAVSPSRRGNKGNTLSYAGTDRKIIIALGVCALLYLFPGVRMGFAGGHGTSIDSPTLGAFVQSKYLPGNTLGWILTAITVLFTAFIIYYIHENGCDRRMIRISCLFLTGFMLYNNVCLTVSLNRTSDTTYGDDALEINEILRENEGHILGTTPQYYDDLLSVWLDARLDRPLYEVTNEQLISELVKTGGKYKPFVPPVVQAPNKGAVITPEADTFILGATVAEHVEIAEGNEVFTTTNGRFTAVTVKEGNRLLDTAFVHIDNDTLSTNMKNNGIWIMDPARKKAAVLEVTVWAKGSGRIRIGDTEFTLTSKLTAYTVTVEGAAHIPVEALDHNVTLTTYTTRVLP